MLAPNNNRGMTYQTDEKHLTNLREYLVGVAKLAINRYINRFLLRAFTNNLLNRLTAMVPYMEPHFFELCASLITFQIFVRCQRLIARNVADGFLFFSLADTF
jgi:hypothetical protein